MEVSRNEPKPDKPGLRSRYINKRFETALNLVSKVLNKDFPTLKIKNKEIGTMFEYPGMKFFSKPIEGVKMIGDAVIEIHHPKKGRIAVIHIKGSGKPVIHMQYDSNQTVTKYNKDLGDAISNAFKKSGKFIFAPSVKVHKKLPTGRSFF